MTPLSLRVRDNKVLRKKSLTSEGLEKILWDRIFQRNTTAVSLSRG
jgi:hypothetical protein